MGEVGAMAGVPGDESFEERLVRELPLVRAYLRRVAPGRDVEDLVQDVATRAWKYRDSYDGEREIGGWLRAVALRVLLDRRAEVQRAPAVLEDPTLVPEAPASAPHAREEAERALERLSAVERDVMLRFHAREETLEEIARELGLPVGTVKSHLHRARRRLSERGDA